ncbi:ribosome-associated translation inhibitor RaiA [Candidatus Falkowbacteria bacterium]|nr:ribosome-associated translation inhibitor RaiA [Candidatus Falkowbacteria bacterium]
MKLNIKATNLELTPKLKDYAQLKMDMLDKYLGKLKVINAHIEVSKTSNHHLKGEIYSAEVNLSLGSDLLRVEKTEKDLFKAIDKVKDHLELVIKKYKDKKIGRKKQKKIKRYFVIPGLPAGRQA